MPVHRNKKHKSRKGRTSWTRERTVATPEDSGITKLLTPSVTAKAVGVTKQTLAMWRAQRKHLPFVKVGWYAMYRASDVEAFIQSRVVAVAS